MLSYNYEQGTLEWHQLRLGRFTGSEIHRLIFKKGELTKGNLTYITEKVAETDTGKTASDFEGYWMERGKELEPKARTLYELSKGCMVENVGFITYGSHAGMSSDGLVDDDGSIEIKCPNLVTHYKYLQIKTVKDVPDDYYWQMQMCLMVTGRKWCDFVSYHPDAGVRMLIFRVDRNEDDIELLRNCLKAGIEEKIKQLEYIKTLAKY